MGLNNDFLGFLDIYIIIYIIVLIIYEVLCMKLYRLVQNPITTMNPWYADKSNFNYESLYYSLGYVSFTGEKNNGYAHKYSKPIEGEGKYFYMFLEDALDYLPLSLFFNDCYKVVEYDIPEEIVYDIIGVGEYGYSSPLDKEFEDPKAETYIKKNSFGDVKKASSVISEEEKIRAYIKDYRLTVNALQVLLDLKGEKPKVLTDLDYDSIDSISDKVLIEYLLEKDKIINSFLQNDSDVIKTEFITGRSVIVHRSFEMKDKDVKKADIILLKRSCFTLSSNYDEARYRYGFMHKYARLIEQGEYEEAREYMKTYK